MISATKPRSPSVLWVGVLLLLMATGALVTYKVSSSVKALAKAQDAGTLGPEPEWIATTDLDSWMRPLAAAANYFSWVFIALAFGVLIGALVRAYLPASWLSRTLG